MSHINRSEEELLILNRYLENRNSEEADPDLIKEILEQLVPKKEDGKPLVSVRTKNGIMHPASFYKNLNMIYISPNRYRSLVRKSTVVFSELMDIKDKEKFNSYYEIFVLLHEVEHVYQKFIGNKTIPYPYASLSKSYNDIMMLDKKDYIIPRPITQTREMISFISYALKEYFYICERNANIEACRDIIELAKMNGEKDLVTNFEFLNNAFTVIGYEKDNKGCIYHTYKGMVLLDKYRKLDLSDVTDEDEKMRFGYEIQENDRIRLIKSVTK